MWKRLQFWLSSFLIAVVACGYDGSDLSRSMIENAEKGLLKGDKMVMELHPPKGLADNLAKPITGKADILQLENEGRIKAEKEGVEGLFVDANDVDIKKFSDRWQTSTRNTLQDLESNIVQYGFKCHDESLMSQEGQTQLIEEEDSDPLEIQNHEIKKFECEFLKNKYKCTKNLLLRCAEWINGPLDFQAIYFSGGQMSATNYANNSAFRSPNFRYGGKFFRSNGTYQNISGLKAERKVFTMNFNYTKAPENLNMLILSVNFGGAILVKFNGHIVYSMPQGSRMLEIGNPLHIQVGSEARGFFGMGSRRKILEEKPTVNIGYSEVELPSNSGLQAQICLKRFVKSGNNMLEFVVVGAGYNDFDKQGKNHFSFVLSATQKYCQQWDKSWQEECAFED